MPPPRSSNKENSPPAKRPKKTVLSAAASRARNAPLTGALSESPSQLPEPPPGHQTARTRSSTTKAKRSPAFTVFTNNTGATEQIIDDADPTTSIIDECTVPDIVDRCSLTDHDLFSELTADEIRRLVERLLPDLQEHDYGALYLDVFPRRDNRNLALGLGNIVDQVPTNLGMYWKLLVPQLIELSHSKLALLVGSAGVATYVDYLKQNNIRHQILPSNRSVQGYQKEIHHGVEHVANGERSAKEE
ncbi:hypothetical protein J4E89_003924 [Alternaria sp. Ai002NY15]|nr:hypothetical protein J4E89_003924 [Alternaria sp. Ai002NY15]